MPPRPSKPHWILRVTPDRHHAVVTRVGAICGGVCSMIWTLAAFAGLFLSPIAYAIWHPEAPVSRLLLRLSTVVGKDASLLIYSFVMLAVIGVIYTGHSFLEYVSQKAKSAQPGA